MDQRGVSLLKVTGVLLRAIVFAGGNKRNLLDVLI